MRAWCDRGIWRVVRGSGLTGGGTSSLRTGGGDRIARTRGFRADPSADGAGSEVDGFDGLPFRREERLGRLACARGPLTIITARGVLLFPVVEQGLPRLFGYSRLGSGIRQFWQFLTAYAE